MTSPDARRFLNEHDVDTSEPDYDDLLAIRDEQLARQIDVVIDRSNSYLSAPGMSLIQHFLVQRTMQAFENCENRQA